MVEPDKQCEPDAKDCCSTRRRHVLVAFGAIVLGGLVSILPMIPGVAALTDPLRRRRRKHGRPIRITTLDAVPADGLPHRFQVVATRFDAWNKYPPEPIDGVYLVRPAADQPLQAFCVTCPHLGCAVDYKSESSEFQCPCHTSGFALDGSILYGPSPRRMDNLEVEVRNGSEVWISYKRFRVGTKEKIEV